MRTEGRAYAAYQSEQHCLDTCHQGGLSTLIGRDVYVDTVVELHLHWLGVSSETLQPKPSEADLRHRLLPSCHA